MAWMYLTPIIYPESIVPERYRLLYQPQSVYRAGAQLSAHLLEGLAPDWPSLAYFHAPSRLVLFVFGYWWFAKTRRNFADVI